MPSIQYHVVKRHKMVVMPTHDVKIRQALKAAQRVVIFGRQMCKALVAKLAKAAALQSVIPGSSPGGGFLRTISLHLWV